MPRRRRPPHETRRVAMFVYDGANSVDVAGPLEVFASVDRLAAERDPGSPSRYAIELIAPTEDAIRTGAGLRLLPDRAFRRVRGGIDTLLVAGGDCRALVQDVAVCRWLARMAPRVRRMGSVCSGAFLLAAAGILDGRRATTHWSVCSRLAEFRPEVRVDPDPIWIEDGGVYTSAGVTAGMDLALALVEEDLGSEVALDVARQMVFFLKRPGGQSQFSTQLEAQSKLRGPLAPLPDFIADHLGEDLGVEALAEHVAMSPRNFARVFAREMGLTPARYVEKIRVEAARRLLEEAAEPLEAIADACGFASAERMRRTFVRHLRVTPQDYRRRFTHSASVAA